MNLRSSVQTTNLVRAKFTLMYFGLKYIHEFGNVLKINPNFSPKNKFMYCLQIINVSNNFYKIVVENRSNRGFVVVEKLKY